jgi:hypothetical protein
VLTGVVGCCAGAASGKTSRRATEQGDESAAFHV